jgi:hypothetical protein
MLSLEASLLSQGVIQDATQPALKEWAREEKREGQRVKVKNEGKKKEEGIK